MRVLHRKAFLRLPPGALYCKGEPHGLGFGNLQVKGESLTRDWIYLDPCRIVAADPDQLEDRLREMLTHNASYPLDESFAASRDAMYDEDAIFLVFERADLLRLRSLIDRAISEPAV